MIRPSEHATIVRGAELPASLVLKALLSKLITLHRIFRCHAGQWGSGE